MNKEIIAVSPVYDKTPYRVKEMQAHRKAKKLEKILENIIFYGITIPLQLIQTAGVFAIAFFNDAFPELSFFLSGNAEDSFFRRTIPSSAASRDKST